MDCPSVAAGPDWAQIAGQLDHFMRFLEKPFGKNKFKMIVSPCSICTPYRAEAPEGESQVGAKPYRATKYGAT